MHVSGLPSHLNLEPICTHMCTQTLIFCWEAAWDVLISRKSIIPKASGTGTIGGGHYGRQGPTVKAADHLLSLNFNTTGWTLYSIITTHFAVKHVQFKMWKLIQIVFKTNQKTSLLKNIGTKENKAKSLGGWGQYGLGLVWGLNIPGRHVGGEGNTLIDKC